MASDLTKYKQDTINIWFPDQVEPLYNPKDPEMHKTFIEYWAKEKDRIINGFNIGRFYITGWLYWHTVYWKIEMYDEINGKRLRDIKTPTFRDLEWIIINTDFPLCEELGKHYSLVGSRGFGKSIIAASRAGWLYTFFAKSQSVISAGAESYIKVVTDKIQEGLTNIHPIWKRNRLVSYWKKEIKSGFKDKKTGQESEKSLQSQIFMVNYENGNNSMASNGRRPGFHLIDEIGTLPNLVGCIKDSEPCWYANQKSSMPSGIAMFTGTGGDMEVGEDAGSVFYNPAVFNCFDFENTWEPEYQGKIGRFISATKAWKEFKYPQTLAQYLNVGRGEAEFETLNKITILVSDEEKALEERWKPQYEKQRKLGAKAMLKFKAYNPLKPSDSFLRLSSNDFNIEAAAAQKARLHALGRTGTPVELYHDGKKITHKFTDKLPISEFPVRTDSKDTPIMIYEFPISETPPWGLYVAGIDPYRQSESDYSSSLGTIYIFKMVHDIMSEKYQWMFVASYTGRPKHIDEWHENARNLLKYYNAVGLCENDEMSFINYMIYKNEGHYLADSPEWLREISPNSTTKKNRAKGISRSSQRTRDYLDGVLKKYLDEVVLVEEDENKNKKEITGITRVLDPMLLQEIIKYDKNDEHGNYDRIVAAECALALAEHMTPQVKVHSIQVDARIQALYKPRQGEHSKVLDWGKPSLFSSSKKRKGTSKLFL